MMRRPPNIETVRLLLVALLPEDIEALLARDFARFAVLSGFRFPSENPDIGDLAWHLTAIQAATDIFRGGYASLSNAPRRRLLDRLI